MKQRVRLKLVLIILVFLGANITGIAQGRQEDAQELPYEWVSGEEDFPQEKAWTYHYTYLYPLFTGEGMLQGAINDYFRNALNEMTMLVIPMFAADSIMIGAGSNEISQSYEVTCNNGAFFCLLMTQVQTMEGKPRISLEPVVFAASGEYLGKSLTLRGLVQAGPSSQAPGEAVVQVIWEDIDMQMRNKASGWKSDLNSDILKAEILS